MYNFTNTNQRIYEDEKIAKALQKLNKLSNEIDVTVSRKEENGKTIFVCKLSTKGVKPVEAKSNTPELACREAVGKILDLLRNNKQTKIDTRRNNNAKSKEALKDSYIPTDDGITND